MKDTGIRFVFIIPLILILMILISCELFQLQPEDRANPDDPASAVSLPRVISVTPADGAVNIETDIVITATFSEALNEASITSETFSVTSDGTPVGGSLSVAEKIVTFTPALELNGEHIYTVVLTAGIQNTDGRAMSADVSYSFGTRDRSWEAPVAIDSLSGVVEKPQIAFNSSGRAAAVWLQDDGSYNRVYSGRYTVDSGWGEAEEIDTIDYDAFTPQIAVDSSGNATAIWQQNSLIYSNRYTQGSGWGVSADVLTAGASSQPQVAFDSSDRAVAVWRQDSSQNIFVNFYPGGGPWGTGEDVDGNSDYSYLPQVAAGSSDNIIVIWCQNVSSVFEIQISRYNGSEWEAAESIESVSGHSYAPQIAMDSSGNAVALWYQQDGLIYTNRYTAGSGWGASAEALTSSGNSANPQLAMNSSGDAAVVWKQDTIKIYASCRPAGGSWGTAVPIGDVGSAVYDPQVAIDSSGNATAVWYIYDSTAENHYKVYANRYTAGGSWGDAVLLDSDISDYPDPQVAADPWGNMTAVWANGNDICAANYR